MKSCARCRYSWSKCRSHCSTLSSQAAYDLGFLLWGAAMIVLGRALMRSRSD